MKRTKKAKSVPIILKCTDCGKHCWSTSAKKKIMAQMTILRCPKCGGGLQPAHCGCDRVATSLSGKKPVCEYYPECP